MGRWLCFLLLSCVFAQAAFAAEESSYAVVVERTVDNYIVPAHQRLRDATNGLAQAMAGLCEKPDGDRASAVNTAFENTLQAWAGVEFLHFGPLALDDRYQRFAFWPDPHGTGARQLRQMLADKDPALLRPGAIAQKSAAVQGLPALETLLYSNGSKLLVSTAPDAFYCDLSLAVARNMNQIATETLAGWTGEGRWAELMKNPRADNPAYLSHKDAMTELLRRLLSGLEQQHDRLVRALVAPGVRGARSMPYGVSGNSLAFLLASTHALKEFVNTSSIFDIVQGDAQKVTASVDTRFSNIDWALGSIKTDLREALVDERARERLVYSAVILKTLRDVFNRLAPAAGLTAGFPTLDGD